ncbi:hemin-degrading factor [Chitinimonas lacunae]|uniref:Hemin-degrading factor n=1 Tax=Chitinimonas lacunae TaxID=1963018 RepID=A0ABV8MLQ0_9NEIS
MNATDLWQSYQALKRHQPRLRARDAARELGVSEAELVAADPLAVTLFPKFAELLGALEPLGPVMTLTRNEAAVHEKTGIYGNVSIDGHIGLALNDEIDLRFFLSQWRYGFALRGERCSLQFFDRFGDAVHKVFLTGDSDQAAFEQLVAHYASQPAALSPDRERPQPSVVRDAEIDVAGFRAGWLALQDTHEFFPLLRRFGVAREQALRLAPDGLARPVGTDAVETMLREAAHTGLPIMAFVGSPGCIQIHTGPVKRIEPMGPWLNVLDPGFNLHLRMDLFARVWVVSKPTSDGMVTSLECFDEAGELIVQFFGARKPGKPELAAWTRLAHELANAEADDATLA